MGSLVSSRLDFINKNPSSQLSYAEVEHELQHLKVREQLSSVAAIGTLVLAIVFTAKLILGSAFVMGALLAIALFAGAYAYCCRLAESSLRNKQISWVVTPPKETPPSAPPEEEGQSLLSFFSSSK